MKITVLSGSARKNNNTLRVARAMQKYCECEVVDFQNYDLPSFADGYVIPGNETDFQRHLINSILNANLVIVLTPEYNWFPSAEIINTIHQLAGDNYKHIFDNKVIANVGVSVGRGGRMPAVQLGYVFNKVFNFFNLNSITSPKTFEAQEVTKCISAEGMLLDNEAFNEGFTSFMKYSMKVAKRWLATD